MDADELAARLGTGSAAGLLERLPDAVYLVDAEGRVQYANAVALSVLGYAEDDLLGAPSHATIHYKRPDGTPFPAQECPLLRPPATGETVRVDDDWFVRRDGSMVPVAYTSAPLGLAGGTGAVVVFRDVSDRRLEEVRASRARIVAAADGERRRLARDLHDGAQQRLVTTALALDVVLGRAGLDADTRAELDRARSEVRVAVEDLRRLARGLHPSVLEHRGLRAAVVSLTAASPVPVLVEIPEARYPAATEAALYFFIAEALANAFKHSGARAVEVRVDGDLTATVRDDGNGRAVEVEGGGLAGLRDRVAALDGTLTVTATPGAGTVVSVTLPHQSSSSSGQ